MAGRKAREVARRQDLVEKQRAAAERRRRIYGWAWGATLSVATTAAVVVAITGVGQGGGPPKAPVSGVEIPAQRISDVQEAASAAGCTLRQHRSEGDGHTNDTVTYRFNPPHSGDHSPVAARDGYYADDPASTEQQVHALEHGRVLVQYRPGTRRRVVGGLQTLFNEDTYHLILTPNTTAMAHAIAVTAWTRTLTCRSFNARVYDAIRAFKREFQDKAPEQVP